MKKFLITLLSLVCIFTCAIGLAACNFGEKPNDGEDKLSVEGYSYVFSYAEVSSDSEELSVTLKEQLEKALSGTTMAFFKGGVCTSTQDGATLNGTYKQTGEKLSVTIDGQSSEMTVTENSIRATNYLNEATVTLVYVKGTDGNNPVQPEKPDNPSGECKHNYDKYVSFGAEAHIVYCSKCHEKKMEEHKLEGGICLLCGYDENEKIPDTPEPPKMAEINGVYLTLNSDGESYSVTGIKNDNIGEIVIPEKCNNKPVTGIGRATFDGCSGLTSVTIPDSVTSIGEVAFRDCSSLMSITIPDKVTEISSGTFLNCSSLMSITIPDGVTDISSSAFSGCSNLNSINIPDSVMHIDNYAFYKCDGVIKTENGVKYIDKWIFGYDSSFTPDSLKGFVGIDGSAFENCNVISYLVLPRDILYISQGAFAGSSLISISIPDSVLNIGNEVFNKCDNLESITVEKGNTTYHSSGNCIIETASKTLKACCKNSVIPTDGSVTSIGDCAFAYCDMLTSISIPESVTSIGDYAFWNCRSLTSITIPDNVTSIGRSAFYNCRGLTSITFNGTMALWNAIEKSADWNYYTGDYTIYCTDGDIAKKN